MVHLKRFLKSIKLILTNTISLEYKSLLSSVYHYQNINREDILTNGILKFNNNVVSLYLNLSQPIYNLLNTIKYP